MRNWGTIKGVSPYREVDHTADWALHVWASTLEELFVDAARGMYALAGATVQHGPEGRRQIEVSAEDYESLLVAWLQELLFITESQGVVFQDFRVEALTPSTLRAAALGGAAGRLTKMIKAVTYHNLSIQPVPEGYAATVVFDV